MIELNKIYCADSLELMKEIPDKSIDLVLTDPPYLIAYKTSHRKDKTHEFCSEIQGDNDYKLISDYIKECYRILKDNTALYMFCSQDRIDYFKIETERYFDIKNIIIWIKNNWTAGDLACQFGKQYEMIIYANKGKSQINGKRLTDIWQCDRIVGNEQFHQNQKPIDILQRAILCSSKENNIVFDGMAGSGSTLVACKALNRRYIGIEKEQKYVDICNNRLRQEYLL